MATTQNTETPEVEDIDWTVLAVAIAGSFEDYASPNRWGGLDIAGPGRSFARVLREDTDRVVHFFDRREVLVATLRATNLPATVIAAAITDAFQEGVGA